MWAFFVVCAAICTPGVRAALEMLFAELTVLFLRWLVAVAVSTGVVFLWALSVQRRQFTVTAPVRMEEAAAAASAAASVAADHSPAAAAGPARVVVCHNACCRVPQQPPATPSSSSPSSSPSRRRFQRVRNSKMVSTSGSKRCHRPTWMSALAVLSTSLWLPASAATERMLAGSGGVPFTLADNATALETINKQLTTCHYAKTEECVNNATTMPEFGTYKKGPGKCVAFDSAYIGLTYAAAALPNRYLPIDVKEANEQGFNNRFSKWSEKHQADFKLDCPLLYDETIGKGDDLLCCTEDQYKGLHQQVSMIPGYCNECKINLRNIWCQFTCNPSNSMFLEVNQVRVLNGDKNHSEGVFPAMEEATYYVGKDWVRDLYDYCEKDSSFPVLCNPNSNCTDGYGLLEFMGSYKFNSLGSPLQVNFKTKESLSKAEQEKKICPCGDANATDCILPMDTQLKSCAGVCGSLCGVSANDKRKQHPSCYSSKETVDGDSASSGTMDAATKAKWAPFMNYMADNLKQTDFTVLNYVVAMLGAVIGLFLIVAFLYVIFRSRKYAARTPTAVEGSGATGGAAAAAHATEERLSWVDDFLSRKMQQWGSCMASGRRPFLVMGVVLTLVFVCACGLTRIEVETDPVKLWVAETSRPFKERDRYGELFMPFYRTEQVIMVPKDGGNINRREYVKEALRIQESVSSLTVGPKDAAFPQRVKLEDICWKATGTKCTVNAITQYFQNSMEHFDFYDKYGLAMEHFSTCLYSPETSDLTSCGKLQRLLGKNESLPSTMSDCPCLSAFGAPMNLYNTYLGGFPGGADTNATKYLESRAMLSTALVYNYYDKADNKAAIKWEREYIKLMKEEAANNQLFTIYFMAETSVQDEIERESSGDMTPVILSYTLMIIYVSLGINRWRMDKSFFVTSKVSVGFIGVFCIMLAVASTIGLFMWCGVKLQLVIMEVVPFLTLAIGVDNIFLIVHAVDQKQQQLERERPELFSALENVENVRATTSVIVGEAIGYIGPSIAMASFAEAIAFAFGCISPMPAVLWFAAFSAAAVIINFSIQMTLLLAIVTLDKRRELSGHYDFVCCRRASPATMNKVGASLPATSGAPTTPFLGEAPKTPLSGDTVAIQESESYANATTDLSNKAAHAFDRCVDAYSWFLSLKIVKLLVLLFFLTMTLLSIPSIENIDHGLPQAESMPSDSYLIDYFNALDVYLATGPPIFFVAEAGYKRNPKKFDFNDKTLQAKLCRSKEFCDDLALPKIIDALANEGNGNITHFSKGVTYSWMDDFWGFVSPDTECCRVDSAGAYMPIEQYNASYTAHRTASPSCLSSMAPPVPEKSFNSLFGMFSTASAGPKCAYGGGSIYRGQFSIDNHPVPVVKSDSPQVVLNSNGYGDEITAFSYMVISTANPTQRHFIDAYNQARRAAQWISDTTGIDVWPYSVTFVFFDQYLTVVHDTYLLVGLAIVAIFVIHAIYFGGLFYPLVIALAVTNIVIHVMGLMHPFDIMLNGLSVVNLIIAAGVSVEFCGHFVRMFAKARGSGDERAKIALRKVLVSVLFGITITKVVGLSALTLADSRIFQKYYFRMYMAIVLCGVLNGMVLLPVVLSICVDVSQFCQRQRAAGKQPAGTPVEIGESPAYRDGKLSPRERAN
ncbi:TPA: hypothetical protein N0F65_002171 [Lagenidium giganteum]|uniref:SSD domain-containing protein n=1 Tax=Lagenidium giganteum TaxID=4803 RepID=A0AAV2YIH7_9STRA|nr:TPA: hypothetical protein N0F65_002171 [Lagenidium giganteum]